jgi:hypothetical protein
MGAGPWLAFPPLGTWALIPQYRQSLGDSFLIVYFACGFESLVYGSHRCKLFKKLLFGPKRVNGTLLNARGSTASYFCE